MRLGGAFFLPLGVLCVVPVGCEKEEVVIQEGAEVGAVTGGLTAPFDDSIYPNLGDRRIDVTRYRVDMRFSFGPEAEVLHPSGGPEGFPEVPPPLEEFEATVNLELRAEEPITELSLDVGDLLISQVTVGGEKAETILSDAKLIVRLPELVDEGGLIETEIRYTGRLQSFEAEEVEGRRGWLRTESGGGVFVSEPRFAHTWLPCNDHPRDKARFEFRIDVPRRFSVATGGRSTRVRNEGERTIYESRTRDPMAPYLATIAVDRFRRSERTLGGGPQVVDFVPEGAPGAVTTVLDAESDIVRRLSDWYGPFPFETSGTIVSHGELLLSAPAQPRPLHTLNVTPAELARGAAEQWFGGSVSVTDWSDIWLVKGLSSYAAEVLIPESQGARDRGEANLRVAYAHLAGGFVLGPEDTTRSMFFAALGGLPGFEGDRSFSRARIVSALRPLLERRTSRALLEPELRKIPDEGLSLVQLQEFLGTMFFRPVSVSPEELSTFAGRLLGVGDEGVNPPVERATLPPAPAEFDRASLFSRAAAERGMLFFHALREELGDRGFHRFLRDLSMNFRGGDVAVEELRGMATNAAGRDLSVLFREWVYSKRLPPLSDLQLFSEDFGDS